MKEKSLKAEDCLVHYRKDGLHHNKNQIPHPAP